MRLGASPASLPPADDVATALSAAARELGQRPAITLVRARGLDGRRGGGFDGGRTRTQLRPGGGSEAATNEAVAADGGRTRFAGGRTRSEQGMASLHQWAAKGAHWLTLEHLLEPGDVVGLVGPVGWLPAAFCVGAWWAGLAVRLGPAPETVTLVHEAADPGDSDETVWFGDGFDGSPASAVPGEAYTVAVQTFPDQPPAPGAAAALPAVLDADGRTAWSQRQLLAEARSRWQPEGTLGVELAVLDPLTALLATAARPVATGHATVVLDGVDRDQVAAEGVATWA